MRRREPGEVEVWMALAVWFTAVAFLAICGWVYSLLGKET